jgi:pimeloyl-ACP methyl ester carboxylesterase
VRIERGGVGIHYETTGRGPAVVLHTGGAGDGGMWREHVPHLDGFRLVLLDHRGRGRSDRPATVAAHRIEEYVADVVAVLDAEGIDRAGFVGYSMGAQIGYALAAAHPDRLTALACLGVTAEPEGDPAGTQEYVDFLRTHGSAGLVQAIEEDESVTLPAWLAEQFVATDAEQMALSAEAQADFSPWDIHDRIACPTIIVAGTEEDPDRLNSRAAAEIADASAVWLDGLGHVGAFLAAEAQCAHVAPHLRAAAAPA